MEKTFEEQARVEALMAAIDRWHTKMCYLGSRRLAAKIAGEGLRTNRKEVTRLMAAMGIYAVFPKPNLSLRNQKHKIHPYLLRNVPIFMPNQVWAVDITYIKLKHGHMYLTAIIDWHSRYIVGWELSDTLDTAPVLDAARKAIDTYGTPAIINSDQGSQFTSEDYVAFLKGRGIRQSMDGKARWVDNVVIERWFRSLKWDNIYVNEYSSPKELRRGIAGYVEEYNCLRPHQSHEYKTPKEVYNASFHMKKAG
jgi:putative transposase